MLNFKNIRRVRSTNLAHQKERSQPNVEKELHQRKAQVFYDRKRELLKMAQQDPTTLAVAFDFQKELPLPNKTTSNVFYRSQLSVHSFNIHELADDNAYIYVYNETVARRRSDDVASLLLHFFNNFVPDTVKHLHLFCDGCPGQVHFSKRFDSIRGRSYMECDRDLSMVNKRRGAELQEHWMEELRSARKKPSPFNVIEPTEEVCLAISEHLKPVFKATCPIPTRPVRELSLGSGFKIMGSLAIGTAGMERWKRLSLCHATNLCHKKCKPASATLQSRSILALCQSALPNLLTSRS